MKRTLTMTALGMALLSSCTLVGNPFHKDVTGQLSGFSANQNLGIALVGYNGGQFTADGSQSQVIDKFLTKGFAVDLPKNLPYGTYRVIVFRDADNSGRYNAGDTVLSKDNGKLLVFAKNDDQYFAGKGIKKGWNIYNPATGEVQSKLLNNYDLSAQ